MDFTLEKYDELCRAFVDSGYQAIGIADYLSRNTDTLPEYFVLLRHDVDSRTSHALKLAKIEKKYEQIATYFFRTIPSVFEPSTIQEISELGHNIGYHYETLGQTNGNMEQALTLFQQELEKLRQITPVKVASMHGAPLKPWDNRDIWKHAVPEDFDLLGEVYRDIDYSVINYYNDTGRSWNPHRYNMRDHTSHLPPKNVETTDELITLIRSRKLKNISLLVHPERWSENYFRWSLQLTRDVIINLIKQTIIQTYKLIGRGNDR